ncbi:5924_t:CDS:1, partial [Funneliformis mosseae]
SPPTISNESSETRIDFDPMLSFSAYPVVGSNEVTYALEMNQG